MTMPVILVVAVTVAMTVAMAVVMAVMMMAKSCHTDEVHRQTQAADNE